MGPFDVLISIATPPLVELVTSIFTERSNIVTQNTINKAQNTFFFAAKTYIENYTERHGKFKILGMNYSMNIENIFTRTKFRNRPNHFKSVEELEKASRSRKGRLANLEKIERDGMEIANENPCLAVFGAPGVGKSTFLRRLGIEALKSQQGDYKHRCIPVFIELKSFETKEPNIEKEIIEEFRVCGLPKPDFFVQEGLKQGKFLILLDGLDEVPKANLRKTIISISSFVDTYSKNRFVLSCRIAGSFSLRKFTDVYIGDFEDSQIQQFIKNWFASKKDRKQKTAEACWRLLKKPENMAAKELAHTPLLLTFLCLVYSRSQNFPESRSLLYRKALRILLEEWAAEKQIMRDDIYKGLNTELEVVLLSEIAYRSFIRDELCLYEDDIVEQIKYFLEANLNAPKHLSGEDILKRIAIQQGVLEERASSIYAFSHLTLQEYLVAQYIDDHREISFLIDKHISNPRWREVFFLVSGLMCSGSGADKLLIEIHDKSIKYIKSSSHLRKLILWTQKISSDYIPDHNEISELFPRKAAALFLAIECARITNPSPGVNAASVIVQTFKYTTSQDISVLLAQELVQALEIAHIRVRNPELAQTFDSSKYLHRHIDKAFRLAYKIAKKYEVFRRKKIAMALHNINRGSNRAADIKSNNIFIGQDFVKVVKKLNDLRSLIPSSVDSQEDHRQFLDNFFSLCLNMFKLDISLINIPDKEAQVIQEYFYVVSILIQCQKSAVRVSKKTWQSIEYEMLSLPEIELREAKLS